MILTRHLITSFFRNVRHARSSRQQNSLVFRFYGSMYIGTKCDSQKSLPISKCSSLLRLPEFTGVHYSSNLYSSDAGTEMTDSEIKRAVGDISEKFTEAMELMNDARSSTGTIYFSEDMQDTQAQVEETLADYKNLLLRLNEKQKRIVIQSIGLKMEELKAQISLLDDLSKE